MPRKVFWIPLLFLGLVVAPLTQAEVVLRPHDPAALDRPSKTGGKSLIGALPKIDQPSNALILPFFEVDTTSSSGTTTLYAINNLNNGELSVNLAYLTPMGDLSRAELETVGPLETLSINLRDVEGLPATDGIAEGYGVFIVDGLLGPIEPMGILPSRKGLIEQKGIASGLLTGDFFQVDVGDAFATGERLINFEDLCQEQLLRFLDFGSGTKIRLLIELPQGSDPMTNPPSVVVTPLGEDGAIFPSTDIFTDQFALEVEASDFTTLNFGSLVFGFATSNGGWVYAEYSADGLFSVGLNSVCTFQGAGGPI